MKRRKAFISVFILLACAALIRMGAIAASNYGSSDDPLVTLSYLTEILKPELLEQAKSEIDTAVSELKTAEESGARTGFSPVTLDVGQALTFDDGAELLFRSGDAAISGAVINLTDGSALESGASFTVNNLYIAAEAGCKITAVSECVILIRGTFAVD